MRIGGPDCKQPYDAAILNVSAMSFGSLSNRAIRALNRGAKMGGFAHNTGEGGLSPYHLQEGGDIICEIGTGYFCAVTTMATREPKLFAEKAAIENVKMIEIALSQGAKPDTAAFSREQASTAEIAKIRHVPMGQDVLSRPRTARSARRSSSAPSSSNYATSPRGADRFQALRRQAARVLAICKAMVESGITPDSSRSTAVKAAPAPPRSSSRISSAPRSRSGLIFVHNALVGCGLRERIRIIASGRVVTGFDIAHKLAIGADLCNCARAMMFARLHPGPAVQHEHLPHGRGDAESGSVKGLVIDDKALRVANYQKNTVKEPSPSSSRPQASTPAPAPSLARPPPREPDGDEALRRDVRST